MNIELGDRQLVVVSRDRSELWAGFARSKEALPSLPVAGRSEDHLATYFALYLGRSFLVLTRTKRPPMHASYPKHAPSTNLEHLTHD